MSQTNSDRRAQIFGRLKTSLSDGESLEQRRASVAERLAHRPRGLVPERARKPAAELKAMLTSYLEGQSATVIDVKSKADVPAAVAAYLRNNNLPQKLRAGADPYLDALPWETVPQLGRRDGRATATDEVGLTHAKSAVAETGTLVLGSGADNPVTVTFLPENHIVVVEARDIVGPYEDAWRKIRALYGDGKMPRTVNFVSGPSRTGDIGGVLIMGAHGPRRMCVIIVSE
jgi:L-lactate dehydrogenase complex protein LldG